MKNSCFSRACQVIMRSRTMSPQSCHDLIILDPGLMTEMMGSIWICTCILGVHCVYYLDWGICKHFKCTRASEHQSTQSTLRGDRGPVPRCVGPTVDGLARSLSGAIQLTSKGEVWALAQRPARPRS